MDLMCQHPFDDNVHGQSSEFSVGWRAYWLVHFYSVDSENVSFCIMLLLIITYITADSDVGTVADVDLT